MKWAVKTCQISSVVVVEDYHNWASADKSSQIIIDGRIKAWNQMIITQLPWAVLQNWFWWKYSNLLKKHYCHYHQFARTTWSSWWKCTNKVSAKNGSECPWYSTACKKYGALLWVYTVRCTVTFQLAPQRFAHIRGAFFSERFNSVRHENTIFRDFQPNPIQPNPVTRIAFEHLSL